MNNNRFYLAVMFSFFLLQSVGISKDENNYPIILVHGFMGWGRDEMAGYRYWGGKFDIEEYLTENGFEVYTTSIGPVSSNWDRAIELFYQIKGGQVDYGKAHSDKFGITQKPSVKKFPGLYPEWDSDHPIHLIGHSMGGQTVRMLLYQLTHSIYSDSLDIILEESDLLGEEHSDWVRSITSISTPHDGTTLSNIVTSTAPLLQDIIVLASAVGNDFYEFDLEQWKFNKSADEIWIDYFRRMREHPAWKTKNICSWDASINGAKELNTLLTVEKNVYYFSFSSSSTSLDSTTGFHVPTDNMPFILRGYARSMGKKVDYWDDGSHTDSTWYENDGIVNTISMRSPTTGLQGPDPVVDYRESRELIPGQWNFMGTIPVDHRKPVGHFLSGNYSIKEVFKLYKDHCTLLYSIPK
ncbi:MAG: lipase [Candidatus Marinimicrobia bacterium]|jgi:triacylglycerol lipase|nr:lipase [Candidatus Neomarinimicrobiota bacterium]MBT3617392.1 lipase [Candidatus Neomarinimicrobiota bacterium]MBT3829332.1 lipase [Candidatus Neomarinimicrobiota bacterium]MBT3998290.1 lipase [Candidatus Neomarinimicrobiota bacterium]MBT4281591.1 lipase [Candidatus Neomarinimicrobiota bacterium]